MSALLARPETDPNLGNGTQTPLATAIWHGWTDMTNMLLDDPRTDPDLEQDLPLAAWACMPEVFRRLLGNGTVPGPPPPYVRKH